MDLTPAQPPRPKRSPGKWIILLIVWSIGLIVWLLYALAFGYVVFRFPL